MDWGSCAPNGVPTLDCVPIVFGILINTLLAFVGTAAVIMMIFSGIKMIIARGDAKELDASHKMFFYSIIGLLLVLFSFLIVSLIGYITNVNCINTFGFTSCVNIPKEKWNAHRSLIENGSSSGAAAAASGGLQEKVSHP